MSEEEMGVAQFDEDDELLAPPRVDSASGEFDDEDGEQAEGEWQFAHGFPDTRRAVRIWVDEDTRRLTKVRLSTRWRERLGGRPLEAALLEAFYLANMRADGTGPLAPPPLDEPVPDPTLTWDDYDDVAERIQQLMEEADELNARAPEQVRWADYAGTPATASSSNGNVTVTLSLAGLTESITIAPKWLAQARMGEVAEAIMTAHQRAYARYEPPTFIPGEHEELAQKVAEARAALNAIVSKELA